MTSIRDALASANKDLKYYKLSVEVSEDEELPYTVVVSDPGGRLDIEGCYDEEDVVSTLESTGQTYKECEEEDNNAN